MTDGRSAGMVVGAVVMVLLPIPFTIQAVSAEGIKRRRRSGGTRRRSTRSTRRTCGGRGGKA